MIVEIFLQDGLNKKKQGAAILVVALIFPLAIRASTVDYA